VRRKLQEKYQREFLLKPNEIAIDSLDDKFLKKVCEIVKANLSDPEFSVEIFANKIAMSRANLYRKLKAVVNQTASEFIRSLRLKRSAQLLQQHAGNITEIAFEVGFTSTAYFSKCFREQFGCSPSEYLKKSSKIKTK
jgi:AraC-like DNA-binding protein